MDVVFAIHRGDGEFGITAGPALENAWNAVKPFKEPIRDVPQICNLPIPTFASVPIIVLKDSPIQKVEDLKGKRIGVGLRTSVAWTIFDRILKKNYGFSLEDIEKAGGLIDWSPFGQGWTKLAEGKLDAVIYSIPHPTSDAIMVHRMRGLRVVDYSEKDLELNAKIAVGYVYTLNFDKWYPGMGKHKVANSAWFYVVKKDLPEELVYEVLECVYRDGGKYYEGLRAEWAGTNFLEEGPKFAAVPWHPGAIKFWRDKKFTPAEPLNK
jgi:hypothetical protein